MIKQILGIAIAISTLTATAQNEVDALRYSTQNLTGTARYSAMGGAFGSLGGEFSALSSNPAGIGMYQFTEFTFTPSLNVNSTKSYYGETHLSDYKSGLNIGNLGLVFTVPKENSDWKRVNIGIGWNQLANYDRNITVENANSTSSIVENIIGITNGTLTSDLTNGEGNTYSQMAWNTYLIDPLYNSNEMIDGQYVSNFSTSNITQIKTLRSTGGMNEFVIAMGGSYQEKLYLGATIGIPSINYYEYSEHTESINSEIDTISNLRKMQFTEEYSAYGTGYNLKVGGIYRISETTKIGASVHTPTFFSIEEDYYTSLTTFFKDSSLEYSMGYPAPFTYNLITPLKASVSASTIFNKNILISGEYEIIDYSTAKYLAPDFENANKTIENIYQRTENLKVGAEINIKPFILRAGYAKYGSAFANKDFSRESFSYGIGINNGSYFMDIAYVLTQGKDEHLLYSEDYIDPISLANTNHNLLFTLGFRY